MKRVEILCTLGPASMNEKVIKRLEALGVSLFRINLSHTKLSSLGRAIRLIQSHTRVPICLDTEGAQIRTGALKHGEIRVHDGMVLKGARRARVGDGRCLSFYPDGVTDLLRPGDLVSLDFNAALVQVVECRRDGVRMRVLNGGVIGQNKAVTVERDLPLPTLTPKDAAALRLGMRMGIRHVALSFANRAEDVTRVRSVCGRAVTVISKIECRNALLNLDPIARRSDALLIDRGDLSRQEPIERIPALQKYIIRRAHQAGRKVYVATNLLESMVTSPKPTRAEVNDVINTLLDGADGLVLAAETAIGQNPIGCAAMIVKLVHEHDHLPSEDADYYPRDAKSLLVEPHGGRLVHRELETERHGEADRLPKIAVTDEQLMDCEQIALGTYSPLSGFMGREALASVLRRYRMPDGAAWTLPVLLQIDPSVAGRYGRGERVALTDRGGSVHAILDVSESFRLDLRRTARDWFGSESSEHPGVRRFFAGGPYVLAGEVTLVRRLRTDWSQYALGPWQSRLIFTHKGWSRVVGFHTRNVPHRAHEYIQCEALERTHADGLYLNPLVGGARPGDFRPEVVLRCYQAAIEAGAYPAGKTVLGGFMTYPRFSGPREAVFTALCRQNMGCSHFIVGRNHSGVGGFYEEREYPRLFDRVGPLGVTPVFFGAVGYDSAKRRHRRGGARTISGTRVREALRMSQALPDWCIRRSVQEILRTSIRAGRPVFLE